MISVRIFEVNFFSENTYLLYDETKEAVLIDCGCLQEAEKQALSGFIEKQGLSLKHNLCTHLHLDHTFGNEYIEQHYGIRPEASAEDELGLPSAEEQSKRFGLPVAIHSVPLSRRLQDGDVITFGQSELHVLAVPGHTPGGLAFYAPKDGFVVVGDSLFAGSIGRTDLWGGNHATLIQSIRRKLMTLPDETRIYPGHGPATTVAVEKKQNPYI